MTDRVRSWQALAALNARLFRNCLAGVDQSSAALRPSPQINPIAFVAIHVVEARHFICTLVGGTSPRPFLDRFDGVSHADAIRDYPALEEILQAWDRLSANLDEALSRVEDEAIDAPTTHDYRFPIADPTVNGSLAFMLQHESYHLGQLALLRKLVGLPSMRYD
jgi:uncharacterized damage-inducible protein DinB